MKNRKADPSPPLREIIVCRCESVTLGQVGDSIRTCGARTVNEVKKLTRAGMGLCQGRTCSSAVARVLEQTAQVPPGTEPYQARPPARPVPIESLAALADGFKEPTGPVSVAMLRKSEPGDGASEQGDAGRRH